jgi:hypothetical protein
MLKKTAKSKNFHLIAPTEQLRFDFFNDYSNMYIKNEISINNLSLDYDLNPTPELNNSLLLLGNNG